MSKSIFPKARKDGLVISKVGDETVVYDTETNKASCLNGLTTVVWEACDGNTETTSLLDTVKTAGYQDANDQIVLMAIDQLDQAGLFEASFSIDGKKKKSLNRREMLQMLGTRAAAVLPIVSTINIQPAIAQGSGTQGDSCVTTADCAPGFCCNNGNQCQPPDGTSSCQ